MQARPQLSRPARLPLRVWPAAPRRSAIACRAAVQTSNETERRFQKIAERGSSGSQAGGAGGVTTYEALKRADAAWLDMRTQQMYGPRPEFVRTSDDPLPAAPEYDVAVCGGTLGIFLACALQLEGLKVVVVERGPVAGREQEWNISRAELVELVKLGVLTEEEAEECISMEFNPVRAGFHGSPDVWTRDVLNLGVRPDRLVERARRKFEAIGGRILERTPLNGLWVHPNGVGLDIGSSSSSSGPSSSGSSSTAGAPSASASGSAAHASSSGSSTVGGSRQVTSRLVLDCMGHASPIVRQIRHGQKPDGVCLVVGTCARGFPADKNTSGDLIYTFTPSQPPAPGSAGASSSSSSSRPSHLQLFWEAFPAGSGPNDRTTYMFTYVDAHPDRPSLESLLEEYWHLMPQYQGVDLEQLEVQRILFGCFPTYRDSPLEPGFDRVLQVGDASGIQSPLSFGGFGALTRHLRRLTSAVKEALQAEMLDRQSLGLINAYNPGLSGAWMLQRAMSIPADSRSYDPDFINTLLGANFVAMSALGEDVMKPFLQDVMQAGGMARTLAKQIATDPGFVPKIIGRVGLGAILGWSVHFGALALYTALDALAAHCGERSTAWLPPRPRYLMRRALDNWKYGSGGDYHGPHQE